MIPRIDVDRAWESIVAILLAMAGRIARMLSSQNKRRMRLGIILSELFVSAFAGYMAILLARTTGLSGDWIGLAAGIAGWAGSGAIDLILKLAGKSLGVDMEDKEKNEERNND